MPIYLPFESSFGLILSFVQVLAKLLQEGDVWEKVAYAPYVRPFLSNPSIALARPIAPFSSRKQNFLTP